MYQNDIDISIEEIRESIREEKEAARVQAQEKETPENSGLEESTDSDFTVTFDGVPGLPGQDSEEEEDRQDRDMGKDSVTPEVNDELEKTLGGRAALLSPRQRQRRQSLARFKKKKWGDEWLV